ncbi:hypothetical protein D3C76_1476820 [compost metagenome]
MPITAPDIAAAAMPRKVKISISCMVATYPLYSSFQPIVTEIGHWWNTPEKTAHNLFTLSIVHVNIFVVNL